MKVRAGIAFTGVGADDGFDDLLVRLDEAGVDSLWLSELISARAPDPIVGLAYAAARTRKLKLGTGVSVLPGRNPVLFAKQLATLGRLAPKRILPAVGLGPAQPADRDAFPIPAGARRGDVFDEALLIVRRLLAEPAVTFHGRFFHLDDTSIGEPPVKPLDLWLGGSAPAALTRIGRLGDGWLASLITPDEAAAGIAVINDAARDAGRSVEQDHFGISLPVVLDGPIPPRMAAAVAQRRAATAGAGANGRPAGEPVDPAVLIPVGWDGLRAAIGRYVDAGVTKFVVRAATPPADQSAFVDHFVHELQGVQT